MRKLVHYVFATYKRKQILTDELAQKLAIVFQKICSKKGFEIINQNILIDHVHMLIKKNASDNNEYIMKMIKGISSREIFKLYPSNRIEFRKLWGRSYRAEEIKDENHLRQVIRYIDQQKIKGVDKRIKAGNREVYSQVSEETRKPAAERRGFLEFLDKRKPRRSVSGFRGAKGVGSRAVPAGRQEVHSQASGVAL